MQEAKTLKGVYKILRFCYGFFARVSDKVLKSNYFCAEKPIAALSAQCRTSGVIIDAWTYKSVTKSWKKVFKGSKQIDRILLRNWLIVSKLTVIFLDWRRSQEA